MSWDISSLLAKALILIAVVMVIGGGFSLFLTSDSEIKIRRHLYRYVKIGALIGLFASALYFFVQVGAINQTGLSGMFDRLMISILVQSGLGYATLIRGSAFFIILILIIFKVKTGKSETLNFGNYSKIIFSFSILLLAYSSSLIGHVAELKLLAAIAIGLHVLAISMWVGSLYPLWYLCKHEELEFLQSTMQRFGEMAIIFVAVLIISGVFLLVQLLESPVELVSTAYGLILLFKLTGVLVLLSLGAMNKLRLVPELTHAKGIMRLKGSITLEIVLALLVLVTTAYLTTLVGLGHAG